MTFRKIIGLILVLVLMAAGGFYLLRTERDEGDKMLELYAEVEPLAKERDDLLREMDGMETDIALKTRNYSTFQILFTELNTEIFYTAYPVMRDHGVVGMLGMNAREAPFYYYKLTVEEVQHLIANGWGTCLVVDSYYGQGFKSFYESFKKQMETYNIPAPTTVYFTDEVYYNPETMDETFKELGITTMIFNGKDGRTSTVTDVNSDLWVTYAMPWNYTTMSQDFELLGRTDGGNQVYTLKFTEHWDKLKNFKQEESQEFLAFQTVLEKWDKERWIYKEDLLEGMDTVSPTPYIYLDTTDSDVLHDLYLDEMTPEQQLLLPRVRSSTLDWALDYHRSAADNAGRLQSEMEARKAEIGKQVADLNAQIDAVYKKYNVAVTPTPEAEMTGEAS